MKWIVVNAMPAYIEQVFGAAQPAWRGAADLDMRFLADRLQLEHGVEGRDLQRPDIGHLQEVGDRADRGFRDPAAVLLLHPPQDRDHRRGLSPRREFCNLLLRP